MIDQATDHYLVALGSNMRSARYGGPRDVLAVALDLIACTGVQVAARSSVICSRPLGPSAREYANQAALLAASLDPLAMLGMLQGVENVIGRRRRGRRWGARVIDLDIVLWSGGRFEAADLVIPHPEFARRRFVLDPAAQIAPGWRDPVSGRTIRQLAARARR